MACDLQEIGAFDVVLFLGVGSLSPKGTPYHAGAATPSYQKELAVIETAAVSLSGIEDERPVLEFLPERGLNGDPTNWLLPNEAAIHAMLKRATSLSPRPSHAVLERRGDPE